MMRGFDQRYLFSGSLELTTALHIGGGGAELGTTDSPVLRTADGQPFIPGSSLKGAFRSTVEKLAATVGLKTCGLIDGEECVSVQGAAQEAFNQWRRERRPDDASVLQELKAKQCTTCWLFGSPYVAGRVLFSDSYLAPGEDVVIQRRDGVAIDRDSERAMDGLLYNYEVVPATVKFTFEILLENPIGDHLGLTCLGLTEFVSGFGVVGGMRSRGLGRCRAGDLKIYVLDLAVADSAERANRLKRYLLGNTTDAKMTKLEDAEGFLAEQIEALLS